MNPIETLRADLERQLPITSLEIDAPALARGVWHLDIRPVAPQRWVVVEWRHDRGFGVSTPDEADFGTKADERYLDLPLARDRVLQLLATGQPTQPPCFTGIRA